MKEFDLKACVPTYPGFPKEGVNFYDITGLFKTPEAFAMTVQKMTRLVAQYQPDRLFAIDSKGFIFAAPVAANLGIGLSLLRKASKLPGHVVRYTYQLEYGTDEMEARSEDFDPSERLVVIDDVLATGGTLAAGIALLRKLGGNVVGAVTSMEIGNLNGRSKLDVPFSAMLYFPE
ncbi:MAG: adenine phosphoribosyltransferase [Alphaproteobacteria bacterium]|nr:adenine phosphoribosyltransferase [Alphaproteobacteria bacterium]